jgi:GNAT superfamily N-acetyltransferase
LTEIKTRLANENDADEIVRLAYLMWSDFGFPEVPNDWEKSFHQFFKHFVDDPNFRILVCDNPDKQDQLTAMGIGIIYQVTPAFWLPSGKMGYLQWFSTDTEWRGRGLASQILNELIEWLEESGVTRIQLHSSKFGESLYRKAGFGDTQFPNLWWQKPGTTID